MLSLTKIVLFGETDKGDFESSLSFQDGINIVSAPNGFGKSLITSSILWALGIEHVMVLAHDAPSFLPESITEKFRLEDGSWANINKSAVSLSLINQSKKRLTITRDIIGDASKIKCELEDENKTFLLTSNSGKNFDDGLTNLTRFLMEWANLKPVRVVTRQGRDAWLYLENLASLFYVNQSSGWADLFASQVRNYGILEVDESVFEYTLGLNQHLETRTRNLREGVDKKDKRKNLIDVIEEVNEFIGKFNPDYRLKYVSKSLDDLKKECLEFNILNYLKDNGDCDLQKEASRKEGDLSRMLSNISDEEEKLTALKNSGYDKVMENLFQLKNELRKSEDEKQNMALSMATKENAVLQLSKKIRSTDHLTEFKKSNIGFFDHNLVCPTCIQSIDRNTYNMNDLSIEDLQRSLLSYTSERKVLQQSVVEDKKTLSILIKKIETLKNEIKNIQSDIDRHVSTVTKSQDTFLSLVDTISTKKSDLKKINDDIIKAVDLSSKLKRTLEESAMTVAKVDDLSSLNKEKETIKKFLKTYRLMLKDIELTVFQGNKEEVSFVNLDENYLPLYKQQYLKNLASASDQCRIILPYILSCLKTSVDQSGNHIGFVLFDEPIQQNPDKGLRERMITFFKDLPTKTNGQVVIFTSLVDSECLSLRELKGFQNLSNKRFLKIL